MPNQSKGKPNSSNLSSFQNREKGRVHTEMDRLPTHASEFFFLPPEGLWYWAFKWWRSTTRALFKEENNITRSQSNSVMFLPSLKTQIYTPTPTAHTSEQMEVCLGTSSSLISRVQILLSNFFPTLYLDINVTMHYSDNYECYVYW